MRKRTETFVVTLPMPTAYQPFLHTPTLLLLTMLMNEKQSRSFHDRITRDPTALHSFLLTPRYQ